MTSLAQIVGTLDEAGELFVQRETLRIALRSGRFSVLLIFLVPLYVGMRGIMAGRIIVGPTVAILGLLVAVWRLRLTSQAVNSTSWTAHDCSEILRQFEANALCSGLVWSIATFGIYLGLPRTEDTFFLLIIVGSAGVGGPFMSLMRNTLLYLMVPQMTAVLIAILMRSHDTISIHMALLLVLYAIIIYRSSRTYRDATVAAVRNKLVATQAKEVAERANDAKTHFLAVMSHDLRTPLFGLISSALHLIDMQASHPGTKLASVRPILDTINYSAKHLDGLVKRILDAATRGRAQFDVHLMEVDMCALVRETLESQQSAANKKGLRLTLDSPDRSKSMAMTDPQLVRQLVYNLLSNALKFTRSGSIDVGLRMTDDAAVMTISDTGPGIEPDLVRSIFAPFNTVGVGSGAERQRGLGLGLSICDKVCVTLGGSIDCRSALGRGTTFTVKLPRDSRSHVAQSEAKEDERRKSSHDLGAAAVTLADSVHGTELLMSDLPAAALSDEIRSANESLVDVLMVDDALINRDVVQRILVGSGYRVTQAASGFEGLVALACHGYGVVVLDLEMPGMSGLSMIDQFRSLAPSRIEPEWIILTGHDIAVARGATNEVGVFACLEKPIEPKALVRIMQSAGLNSDARRDRNRVLLNRAHLDNYLNDERFGISFLESSHQGYVDECVKQLAEAEAAMRNGDMARLARATHALGGYAEELGDTGTMDVCDDMNRLLKGYSPIPKAMGAPIPAPVDQALLRSRLDDLKHHSDCGTHSLHFYLAVRRMERAAQSSEALV